MFPGTEVFTFSESVPCKKHYMRHQEKHATHSHWYFTLMVIMHSRLKNKERFLSAIRIG